MQSGMIVDDEADPLEAVRSAADAADKAMRERRPSDAIALYKAALQMPEAASPDVQPVLLGNLGHALLAANRPSDAVAIFEQAIALNPNSPLAHRNLGDAHAALGQLENATRSYSASIALDPNSEDWLALTRLGNTLMALGRRDLAIPHYRNAAILRPSDAGVLRNLGNALLGASQLEEAEQVLTAALNLAPNSPEALNSFGSLSLRLYRLDAAETTFTRALELDPHSVETLTNLGTLEMRHRRSDTAAEYYLRALELQPQSASVHYNLGLCCLQQGDYSRGWPELEWRSAVVDGGIRRQQLAQPQWRGEPLDGATILLHAEQGFGDTIQFARYISLVAGHGSKVILQVQPELVRLLRHNLSEIEVIGVGDPLPEFHWQCSLMSLPLAFKTRLDTIPSPAGYLSANSTDVAATFAAWPRDRSKLRVGLTWSGSPGNRNNSLRSIPLDTLMHACKPIAAHVDLFSLQQGRAGDLPAARPIAGSHIQDACRTCKDFADTAALIETLDLVIAVDTAVAHLAGAMGKPVWVLLSDVSDWRWLDDRDDSPWYASARLFRQHAPGDWPELSQRLSSALAAWSDR